MELLPSIIVGFFTTAFFAWALQPLATKVGLVDQPGGRKKHASATPLVGGIAMYLGFNAALIVSNTSYNDYWPLMLSATIMLVVGALDDKFDLKARTRFAAQIARSLAYRQ